MYAKIVNALIESKKTGDKEIIINSIKLVHDEILNILSSDLTYETFSMFVYDKDMVFKINREELSRNSADVFISSNGLFAQVLEMADVKNYNEISEILSNSISNLHSSLSLSKEDIFEEIDELKQALKIVENIYS